MSDNGRTLACWGLLLIAAAPACREEFGTIAPLPDEVIAPGEVITTDGQTPEDFCEPLGLACGNQPIECATPGQATCVDRSRPYLAGYCLIDGGGDHCDGNDVSRAFVDYCYVQRCFGEDVATCVANARALCAEGGGTPDPDPDPDPPPPPPPPADPCAEIEALAGQCPGYGYECGEHPEAQSECFRDVLKSLDNPCILFDADDALCKAGYITIEGNASCMVQECFAITTYAACYGNLEVLCPWTAP